MGSSSEHEQVLRVRAGDERAFASLFQTHYPSLRRFTERYVDPATAEEILQDVFLQVWQQRATWTPVKGVRVYFFAAARNRALNALRHGKVVSRTAQRCSAEGAALGAGQSDPPPGQQIAIDELADAVGSLPEHERVALLLCWEYGMSHAEIAFVLGTTIKRVEIRLSRAITTLTTNFHFD